MKFLNSLRNLYLKSKALEFNKQFFLWLLLVGSIGCSIFAAIVNRAMSIDGAPELFDRFQSSSKVFEWFQDPRLSAKVIYVIPNLFQLFWREESFIVPFIVDLTSWISQLYIYLPLAFCFLYLRNKHRAHYFYFLAAAIGLASLPASVFTANQVGHVLACFWCLLVMFSFGEMESVGEIAFSILLVISMSFSHEIAFVFFIQLAILSFYRFFREQRSSKLENWLRSKWTLWGGVFILSATWVFMKTFLFEYGTKNQFVEGAISIWKMYPGHFLLLLSLLISQLKKFRHFQRIWWAAAILFLAIDFYLMPGKVYFFTDLRLLAAVGGLGLGAIWILGLIFHQHLAIGEGFKILSLIALVAGLLLDISLSSYWHRTTNNLLEINRISSNKVCWDFEDLLQLHEIPSEDPFHISYLAIVLEGKREVARLLLGDSSLNAGKGKMVYKGSCENLEATKILTNGTSLKVDRFFYWRE